MFPFWSGPFEKKNQNMLAGTSPNRESRQKIMKVQKWNKICQTTSKDTSIMQCCSEFAAVVEKSLNQLANRMLVPLWELWSRLAFWHVWFVPILHSSSANLSSLAKSTIAWQCYSPQHVKSTFRPWSCNIVQIKKQSKHEVMKHGHVWNTFLSPHLTSWIHFDSMSPTNIMHVTQCQITRNAVQLRSLSIKTS